MVIVKKTFQNLNFWPSGPYFLNKKEPQATSMDPQNAVEPLLIDISKKTTTWPAGIILLIGKCAELINVCAMTKGPSFIFQYNSSSFKKEYLGCGRPKHACTS